MAFCLFRFCTKESCNRQVSYSLANFSFKKQKNTLGKKPIF